MDIIHIDCRTCGENKPAWEYSYNMKAYRGYCKDCNACKEKKKRASDQKQGTIMNDLKSLRKNVQRLEGYNRAINFAY